jgi:hypothetical protein
MRARVLVSLAAVVSVVMSGVIAQRQQAVTPVLQEPPVATGAESRVNRHADVRELARIASFSYFESRSAELVPCALGLDYGIERDVRCRDDIRTLRGIRDERLDDLSNAAADCESVRLDTWRLSRAYREFGLAGVGHRAYSRLVKDTVDSVLESETADAAVWRSLPAFGDYLTGLASQQGADFLIAATALAIQTRLVSVWREVLVPNFEQVSGAETDRAVVDFGSADKLAPLASGDGKWEFGTTAFRLKRTVELTRVVARVVLADESDTVGEWYGYFDVLGPKETIVVSPSGLFSVVDADGTTSVATLARPLTARLSIFAAELRRVDQEYVFGGPRISRVAGADADRIARRDRLVRSAASADGLARNLLSVLNETFPTPPDPHLSRARTLAAFGRGQTYNVFDASTGRHTSTFRLHEYDADDNSTVGTITWIGGGAIVFRARMIDELERGSVLAMTVWHRVEVGETMEEQLVAIAAHDDSFGMWMTSPFAIWGGARRIRLDTLGDMAAFLDEAQRKRIPPKYAIRSPKRQWFDADMVFVVEPDGITWVQTTASNRATVHRDRLWLVE